MRSVFAAVALFIAAFGLACDDRDDISPGTAATTATNGTKPAPTASPATAIPSPGSEPRAPGFYPNSASDELFIYRLTVGFDRDPGRLFPRDQVVVQDLKTGRLRTTLDFGGTGQYPVGAALAGNRILIATEAKVTRFELDGSGERVLYEAPGEFISDLAASPDGRLAAVSIGCLNPACESGPAVVFIDVASGAMVAWHDHASLRAGGFKGYALQVRWRDDGSGVVVLGGTGSEAVGGRAFAGVDGSLRVLDQPRGYGSISPDARFAAVNTDQLGCMRVGGHGFEVLDLDSGRVIRHETGKPGAYAAWEWSPDGKSVVYQFLPSTDLTGCAWAEAEVQLWLLDIATGVSTRIPDLRALQASWYGDHFVETVCTDWPMGEPAFSRWGDLEAVCRPAGPGDSPGDLFVGGTRIASWPGPAEPPFHGRPQPIGFLPRQ